MHTHVSSLVRQGLQLLSKRDGPREPQACGGILAKVSTPSGNPAGGILDGALPLHRNIKQGSEQPTSFSSCDSLFPGAPPTTPSLPTNVLPLAEVEVIQKQGSVRYLAGGRHPPGKTWPPPSPHYSQLSHTLPLIHKSQEARKPSTYNNVTYDLWLSLPGLFLLFLFFQNI